jgi:hypothetical protein
MRGVAEVLVVTFMDARAATAVRQPPHVDARLAAEPESREEAF